MDCRRCHGMMVQERCSDFFEDAEVWRCVNCGAIVDSVINRHQGVAWPGLQPVLVSPNRG